MLCGVGVVGVVQILPFQIWVQIAFAAAVNGKMQIRHHVKAGVVAEQNACALAGAVQLNITGNVDPKGDSVGNTVGLAVQMVHAVVIKTHTLGGGGCCREGQCRQ